MTLLFVIAVAVDEWRRVLLLIQPCVGMSEEGARKEGSRGVQRCEMQVRGVESVELGYSKRIMK
jgi:hypothetical protein